MSDEKALAPVETIEALEAKRMVDEGKAELIDIRDPSEHARERIPGARLVPLAGIKEHSFEPDSGKAVIFHCRSGNRTRGNMALLAQPGIPRAYILAGGLDAWKRVGLPVVLDRTQPLELMRQVQITVGSMVLLSLLLAVLISPWFALIAAFAGAGLVFAGLTGTCGMARLLALMPWNRPR